MRIRIAGRIMAVALLSAGAIAAQDELKNQPPVWAAKPDVAAFDKVENERLAAAQRTIDQLVAVKGPRTIENTLAPYDEAVRQLNTAVYFSTLVQQVHPDASYRDRATAMTTKVSSAQSALSLNRDVYNALTSLDVSKADPATRYYVQRTLLEFRLAGVDKDDATRKKLNQLNDRLTDDQSAFDRNISDDARTVEVKDDSELEGLPQDFIAKQKRGPDGKLQIPADEANAFTVIDLAQSDALRRRIWESWITRAYPKNRQVLLDMMQTRYQIATIIGYPSWADYNAADKMIGKGSNIAKFISDLDAAARPITEREFAMLLAEKRKTQPGATEIYGYEEGHLVELVRRSQYNFDSETVRPYLPFNQVKRGIMDTAASLFHISFRQELNAPAWDPSVETWDVIDNGKIIGRFYLDMFPRAGKYSHQQMAPVLDGVRGKQLPEAILECNFLPPTATDPGLMKYGDVVTFFHEFGHLMHHILGGQAEWAGISGITMEADFVEAPSQMLEEWMRSPQVLATFAKDYKTGKPIPADLVERMNRASAFGRASNVSFQNAAAAISYDYYKGDPAKIDLDAIPVAAFDRYTLEKPLPSDAHMYTSFNHLAGYSSAYYTYMWDKVISEDFFQQFDQKNLLAGETPMRYRKQVLEPGGSMSANDLVKHFLGRPQNMTAFEQWMGEEFRESGQSSNSSTGKPGAVTRR
ncbi:MAG TPA: M3 family metallopeptidase [Terriglobales bacterium]|nr:M3 family metallopeptidase [Terriglobales bacterium]